MPRAALRLGVVLVLGVGCPAVAPEESVPPADVYAEQVSFLGEWLGEVVGVMGTLEVTELEPGRYRGVFRAEEEGLHYVLAMEQALLPGPGETIRPSNQVLFTWQDGRGGRGHGWLLINREDTALTGEFGYEGRRTDAGGWTFIRIE